MTGVSNRRTGFIILEKELDLVSKRGMHLSVCFIDVDGLKKVNDTFGHEEGDCLINLITSNIKSSVREIDVVSRMGGDEFLIVFPGCHESDVEKVIKRINDKLEGYDKKGLKPYKHSFSYGILEITTDSKLSANDVVKEADEKMYQNKMLKKTIK
jgi:diguanylate cyclase (GGDEF)-like protein